MVLNTGQVGIPPIQINPLGYAGDSQNVVPITNANRIPTGLDRNYATGTEWFVDSTQDTWKLYGFINGLANWKLLASGSVPGGTMISLSGDANTQVFPNAIGNVQVQGTLGQITITEDAANNKLVIALAGGGTAVDQINVDANTAPGTDPVLADATGQITITGGQIVNANLANAIRTNSLAANTFTIQVQRADTAAATDSTQNGISHYNSTQFTIDANGFVSLLGSGGGAPILGFTPDMGTSPVVAAATGLVKVFGQNPASTNGIRVTGALNELDIAMFSPFVGDFAFRSNTGGATRTLTVDNTIDAASSAATQLVKVAGAASGDVWTQYSIGAISSWAIGIDNSDVDSLKINYAASGAVDPSSTQFVRMSATAGTVSQTSTVNSTAGYAVINSSDTASAQSAYVLLQTINTGFNGFTISAFNQGGIARAAARTIIQSNNESLGLNIESLNTGGTATLDFFTGAFGSPALGARQSAAGVWQYPLQPSFLGYLAGTVLNKTGNGTSYTLGTDALTEAYDYGSNFTTAGVFTAPVNGVYDLRAQVTITGTTIATTFVISIVTTTNTYTHTFIKAAGAQDESVAISVLALMSANNTAIVTITVSGEAADTDDIKGGATIETYFCGTLKG